MNGFRYQAITDNKREVVQCLWFPSFIPLGIAEQAARLLLNLVFRTVNQIEYHPSLSLRVTPDNITLFTRRLSVMVAAGIPLHDAIHFLTNSEDEAMNQAAEELASMISAGNSFSQALSRLPGVFPQFFVGFARAGEQSGRLLAILDRLADQTERTLWLRRQVRASLGYPIVLALGALLLSGLLVFVIVPMMAPTLQQMNVELPWLTVALLRLTEIGQHPLIIVSTAIFGVMTLTLFSFIFSPTGRFTKARRYIDELLLYLPVFHNLLYQYSSAQVLSAVSLSVDSGTPLTKALFQASTLSPNIILEERIKKVCSLIFEGTPFEEALLDTQAFTTVETQMLICADESGNLGDGARAVAMQAEEQMEATLKVLTSLIEPLVLGVMSLVVGTVSLATFLPWVNLLQSIF